MSAVKTITCGTLALANPFGASSVSIQNAKYTDPITFKSKVRFDDPLFVHTSVHLGEFEVSLSNNKTELIILKNGITLFSIKQ